MWHFDRHCPIGCGTLTRRIHQLRDCRVRTNLDRFGFKRTKDWSRQISAHRGMLRTPGLRSPEGPKSVAGKWHFDEDRIRTVSCCVRGQADLMAWRPWVEAKTVCMMYFKFPGPGIPGTRYDRWDEKEHAASNRRA
jgi:hypothetical protein